MSTNANPPPFRHAELVSPLVTSLQYNKPPSRVILKQVQDDEFWKAEAKR
jgi:hypothetical protein